MRARLGTILLWSGAVAGVLTVALAAFGLPVALPPALVALVALKLAFAATVGLLVVGAHLRRSAGRRRAPRAPATGPLA